MFVYLNTMKTYSTSWKHPFSSFIAGPSQSGKTTFLVKLLASDIIQPPPDVIIWCYSEWQSAYEGLQNVSFVKELPSVSELQQASNGGQDRVLVILDDKMTTLDGEYTKLFTQGCHHWNLSVIHVVQDAFWDKRRTNRINAQYIVLMKSPGDKLTALNLAKQMFPSKSRTKTVKHKCFYRECTKFHGGLRLSHA